MRTLPSLGRTVHARQVLVTTGLTILIALMSLTSLVGTAVPAAAHTQLRESTPREGAKLAKSPQVLTLTFNEELLELGARAVLTGPDGRLDVPAPTLDGPRVRVGVPQPLMPGGYVLNWRVTSQDGHPVSGALRFTVLRPSPATEPATGAAPSAATASAVAAPLPSAIEPSEPFGPQEQHAGGHDAAAWWSILAFVVIVGAIVLAVWVQRVRPSVWVPPRQPPSAQPPVD